MLIASGGMIFMFLVLFSVLVFGIGQVAWIYLDSKERGDNLAVLWALFGTTPIFMPFILPLPLIIYLIATRAFSSKCNNCGTKVSHIFSSCPTCGSKLKEKCSNCGKVVKDEWIYCPYCDENLKKKEL